MKLHDQRTILKFGFCALTLALSACASLRTHSDYDPQADFSTYQTFAWASEQERVQSQERGDRYISPLDVQRIERAIESELATKGYRQLQDTDQADFLVAFTVGARDKIDVNRYPVTYRGRWVGHWPYQLESVEVHSYTEGMLAIDIYDRQSARPTWHGVARKRVTGSDAEESGPLIREAVSAILNEFPP